MPASLLSPKIKIITDKYSVTKYQFKSSVNWSINLYSNIKNFLQEHNVENYLMAKLLKHSFKYNNHLPLFDTYQLLDTFRYAGASINNTCPPRSQKTSFDLKASVRPMLSPTVGTILSGGSPSDSVNIVFSFSSNVCH